MLSGKSIVFTGTLELKRADAKARAEAAGATVAGDVSGKTTLVVSGKDGGAKLEKAQAKGIEIWDEAAFTAALSSGGSSTASGKKKAEPSANEGPPAKKGKTNAAAPAPAPAPAATGAPTSATSGGGGGRKPDRSVPADGGVFKVHEDYDVKLMQTNIGGGQNNNKFYIIQVLQDQAGSYFAWNRWGRLGEEGQHKLEPHGSAEAAISSFQKKFKDKTKNPWISGAPASAFVKHEGKYQLVEVEDGDGGDGALGKLTADQISKGQSVLERIKAALNGDGGSIAALSSQFYSLIPTTSGRVAPPPIGDMGILAEKEHQLDFWLRMGFEDMQVVVLDNPLEKMYELAVPPTLHAAAATISDKGSIAQSQARGKELEKAQAGKCDRRSRGPSWWRLGDGTLCRSGMLFATHFGHPGSF